MACKVCQTNDHEGLADHLAAVMWERHRDRENDPDKWEDAPAYWQMVMREFAQASIEALRDE